MSDSLWPHGLQHARHPCPSPTPRACSNSYFAHNLSKIRMDENSWSFWTFLNIFRLHDLLYPLGFQTHRWSWVLPCTSQPSCCLRHHRGPHPKTDGPSSMMLCPFLFPRLPPPLQTWPWHPQESETVVFCLDSTSLHGRKRALRQESCLNTGLQLCIFLLLRIILLHLNFPVL